MADYIRREDALAKAERDSNFCLVVPFDALERIPVADVAPVVRCKDCKYGDYDSKPDGAMVCLRTKDGFWRKETDFCSYGEPRKGE